MEETERRENKEERKEQRKVDGMEGLDSMLESESLKTGERQIGEREGGREKKEEIKGK